MTSGLSLSVFVLAVGGALRFTSHTKHSWRHNVATLTKIFAYQEKMFEWVSSSVRKFTVYILLTIKLPFTYKLLPHSVDDPVRSVLSVQPVESLVAGSLHQLGSALPAVRLVGNFPLTWREIVLTDLLPLLSPPASSVQPPEVSEELSSDVYLLPVRGVSGSVHLGARAAWRRVLAVWGWRGQICRAWTGRVRETERQETSTSGGARWETDWPALWHSLLVPLAAEVDGTGLSLLPLPLPLPVLSLHSLHHVEHVGGQDGEWHWAEVLPSPGLPRPLLTLLVVLVLHSVHQTLVLVQRVVQVAHAGHHVQVRECCRVSWKNGLSESDYNDW